MPRKDINKDFENQLGFSTHGNNKQFKQVLKDFGVNKKFKNKTEKKKFLKLVLEKKFKYKGSISLQVLITYDEDTEIKNLENDKIRDERGRIRGKYIVGKGEYVRTNVYREYHSIPFNKDLTYKESLNIDTKSIIDDLIQKIFNRNYVVDVKLEKKSNTIKKVPNQLIDLKNIKMKQSGSLNIDTFDNQLWDTKTNKCVFDYIIYTYKDIKGFKKICNYETLNDIFDDDDCLNDGVSTKGILNFCIYTKISLHALDDENTRFSHYVPDKIHATAPPMVYRLSNNHFYPIPKNKIKSVIAMNQIIDGCSHTLTYDFVDKKKKPIDNVITLENTNPMIEISKIINNDNIIPYKNIMCIDGSIISYEYNNNKYCLNQNIELTKELFKNMNIDYNGEGLANCLKIIIDDCGGLKNSIYNPHTYETLLKAKSNRNHYGLIDANCEKLMIRGYARDINKCYTSIMYEPIDEWIRYDFNDIWELYDGKLKTGLYYIETDDYTLFKKSDIYSNTIIQKALDNNITFTIKYQLIPSYKEPKDILKNIIDKILEYTNNDKTKYKLLINMISGLLAKTKSSSCKYSINNDLQQIFSFINKYPDLELHIHKIPNTEYYLYGAEKITDMRDNNIPMYIQILDQANIKLYDMIKQMGGKLLCRNVDCAVVYNDKIEKIIDSNDWGGNAQCGIPNIKKIQDFNVKDYNFNIKNWKDYNICDSDNWEEIKNVLIDNGGLLLQADAGCGKTYVARNICDNLDKCEKIAPTNKASLNLKGSTIHKFLNINVEGRVSTKKLNYIKRNIDYIIVDEISMISKDIWNILAFVKSSCNITFLLLGDDKQLPPVEDGDNDYFNHPAVKYLCNYNRNILKVVKRYDMDLKNTLNNIENIDISLFKTKEETKINMCYTNKTRKIINKRLNNKYKNDNSIFINANDDDINSQEMFIYEDLPVICNKNDKNGEYYNNETFKVLDYNDNDITLINERTTIKIKIEDFNKMFYLNYCSTIHKYQGSTINEPYTIWDWNTKHMSKKAKYTALSRATMLKNIYIRP